MIDAAPAPGAAGARAERRGAAGVILLDRPQALNALTLPMVRVIAAALDAFEHDPLVARVVIASAGGRAFCAGGDIRLLYEQGRAGDHAAQLAFWREEYQLNRRIKRYPQTDRRADRRHRHGRRRRPQRPCLAPRRQRAHAVRHAGGRHRLLSRRRRELRPAAPARAASAPSSPRPACARKRATSSRLASPRPSRRAPPSPS